MTRTPRKTKSLRKIDIMKPLLFTDLGSDKDSCYGKHYSIAASECKRCGDSDVCAILSQNQLHKEIAKEEKKGRFMDVEEGELLDTQNKKIRKLLKIKGEKTPGKWLSLSKLVPKVRDKFNLTEKDEPHILQRIVKAAEDSKNIELNKSLTKYRYDS